MCRRRMRQPKLADSSGAELTGAGLLVRSLIFRRLLRREVLDDGRATGGRALAAVGRGGGGQRRALAIDRRVAVNLNYTLTPDVINDCIGQCGIRHVLSSRRVMERLKLKLDAEIVYLEDFQGRSRLGDKLAAAAMAWLMPVAWLERRLGLTEVGEDELLTVIFTSGSTGRPKGVMLTHRNVGSNVGAVARLVRLDGDRRAGRHPAGVPCLRLHGHDVDRADAAAEGRLPLQPAGGPRGRQALPPARCDDHDHHAHLRPLATCGGASRRISPSSTWSSPGPRSCRPRWPRPSSSASASGRSRATAPRNSRRSSRPTSPPAGPSARSAIGSRKAPSAGRCRTWP